MDKRTKTWLSILAAILLVCVMVAAAVIAGSAYFYYSHVRQASIEAAPAADRFRQVRQGLGQRQALLEIDDRDQVIVHKESAAANGNANIHTLRALIYNPRDGRVVDVDIPFWLVRLAPSGRLSFMNDNGIGFDSDRIRLSVEDIEKHGPGLLLDHQDRRGAQVLVWTE